MVNLKSTRPVLRPSPQQLVHILHRTFQCVFFQRFLLFYIEHRITIPELNLQLLLAFLGEVEFFPGQEQYV